MFRDKNAGLFVIGTFLLAFLNVQAMYAEESTKERCTAIMTDATSPEMLKKMESSTLLPLGDHQESMRIGPDGQKTKVSTRRFLMVRGDHQKLAKDKLVREFLVKDPKMATLAATPGTELADFAADPDFASVFGSELKAELVTARCSAQCAGAGCGATGCIADQGGRCLACACLGPNCHDACKCSGTVSPGPGGPQEQ